VGHKIEVKRAKQYLPHTSVCWAPALKQGPTRVDQVGTSTGFPRHRFAQGWSIPQPPVSWLGLGCPGISLPFRSWATKNQVPLPRTPSMTEKPWGDFWSLAAWESTRHATCLDWMVFIPPAADRGPLNRVAANIQQVIGGPIRTIVGGKLPLKQQRTGRGKNTESGERRAEGGRRKAEGGRRKAEGGRRKEEGGRRKEEGQRAAGRQGRGRQADGGRGNAVGKRNRPVS
jgi:hypothetical protein